MADSKCGKSVYYDVIVVGGGPIGLSAAYQCAVKHGEKVLVLEQFNFGNDHGSSAGFSRQFRICYSEENLSDLAVKTSKKWDELMKEVEDYTLMERTGTLWFGEAKGSASSSEGNIDAAIINLDKLDQEYTKFTDKNEIEQNFPFIGAAMNDIDEPKAIFVPDGGTVNVPAVVQRFHEAISKCSGCKLVKSTHVTCIDYSDPDKILVTTNDNNVYRGKKVILTPGTYVNSVLSALKPEFPKVINFDIFLWVSTYFKIKQSAHPSPTTWPTWYFFGNPKNTVEPIDHNLYYGFPIEHPTPAYARVAPAYISEQTYYYHLYPNHVDNRPLDQHAVEFTSKFVQESMPDLDPTSVGKMETNCVAGFVRKVAGVDNSGGIVLDFVPETCNRIVLTAGGWCMKYVPLMGIILAQMALFGHVSEEYKDDIEPMNINRGILIDPTEREMKSKALTSSEIAAVCRKLQI